MTEPDGGGPVYRNTNARDITLVRLTMLAKDACVRCAGAPHEYHRAAGYPMTSIRAVHKWSPSHAVAVVTLTRGTVVVYIDGYAEARWWFPTITAAMVQYDTTVETLRDYAQAEPAASAP